MIRTFYGLTQNPFDLRDLELLPQQQEIHDILKVLPVEYFHVGRSSRASSHSARLRA
jgi:hypothetical protein